MPNKLKKETEHRFHHSNKKRKGNLETPVELAVLRTYVENQTILEPILLYCASKCKQTTNCLWGCLKNGQHLIQKHFMQSSFKNWCF